MPISDLCSRSLVSVESETTLHHAAHLMKEMHVGAIVVIDPKENDRPIGLITDRDIAIYVVADSRSISTKVGDIMSTHVVSIDGRAGIADAILLMEEEGVRRLIVLNEKEQACGLVSADDILQLLAEEMYGLGKLVQKQVHHERAKLRSQRIFST